MSDDDKKYVTDPGPWQSMDNLRRAADLADWLREHHDLISPWRFTSRERFLRAEARLRRDYGQAKLREAQGG